MIYYKQTKQTIRKTMRKSIILFIAALFTGIPAMLAPTGSNDPILLRVGDRAITQSDFEAVYRKNNIDMEVADPKSVEDYLELYINFNLKVLEAISLGMDRDPKFILELARYRNQLARPYFNDPDVAEHLVREAYERMQYDVRASHILIAIDKDAKPADTLTAYQKIVDLRNRAKAGESFAGLATNYSDDPAARGTPAEGGRPARRGTSGDLGYFTVFNMVYPFETAAYETPVGDVSQPVRSNFGYHIIKVKDRLPAMGTTRVAHIMLMTPAGSSEELQLAAKERIDSLYERLMSGEDFAELASQYSEDHNSAVRGGEMQPFETGRMVPEFIEAIDGLVNKGDISKPVQSQFGWHIIKLIEKTPPGSYEDEYEAIRSRISRDARGQLSREVVIKRLREEYNVMEHRDNLELFYTIVDMSVFSASWSPDDSTDLNKPILTFGDIVFTQQDFAEYIVDRQAHRSPQEIPVYINGQFRAFTEEKLFSHEDRQLETKYPEFKRLIGEYHDGILLFELTDQMIWSRAMNDTLGLKAFYESNKYDYMGEEKLDVALFVFPVGIYIQKLLAIRSKIDGMVLDEKSDHDILTWLENEGIDVQLEQQIFEKGNNPVVDLIVWSEGVKGPVVYDEKYHLVRVHERIPAQPKAMHEIKGILISDYQEYLEAKWVKELRAKYDVVVDKDVLNKVKQNVHK